jgi:hypothetical protein
MSNMSRPQIPYKLIYLSLSSCDFLTAVAMTKSYVFWEVTPYSLIDHYRRFGGTCHLHFQRTCSMNFHRRGNLTPDIAASWSAVVVRFCYQRWAKVSTAMKIQTAVFRVMIPCRLVAD